MTLTKEFKETLYRLYEADLKKYQPSCFRKSEDVAEAIEVMDRFFAIDEDIIDMDSEYGKKFEKHILDELSDTYKSVLSLEGFLKKLLKVSCPSEYALGAPYKDKKNNWTRKVNEDGTPKWELGDLVDHFGVYDALKEAGYSGPNYKISVVDPERIREAKLLRHYVRAYQARNAVGHAVKASEREWGLRRNSVIMVYLDKSLQYKDEINKVYSIQETKQHFKSHDYIKEVVADYRERAQRYVMVYWNSISNFSDVEGIETKDLANDTRKSHVVKLIGPAGIGKSEALHYMQFRQANDWFYEDNWRKPDIVKEGKLPIYIPLIELRNGITIREKMCNVLKVRDEYLDMVLSAFTCTLYLDGYNEITDLNVRARVAKEINEMIDHYKELQFIIADRSDKSTPMYAQNSALYQINKLSKEQIENFFMRNCVDEKGERKIDIYDKIMDAYQDGMSWLNRYATPLMLVSIVEMVTKGEECPEDITEFYEKYIEYLFRREEIEKNDIRMYTLKSCLRVLAGERLQNGEKSIHGERIIEDWIKDRNLAPEEARQILELAHRMGFLETKDDAQYYGFKNNEIASYFYELYRQLNAPMNV